MEKLPQIINGFLPTDIAVTAAKIVPEHFNPRFDPISKTYAYNIYSAKVPNPLLRRYSAFVPQALDFDAMKKAAGYFVGRHDFAAFMATGSSAKTTVREVFSCGIEKQPSGVITLAITGGGFLYNMVRIIAGTVVYIGMGKISPEDVPGIIQSRDRTKAGKTMPPEGLTLVEVQFDADCADLRGLARMKTLF